MTKREFEVHSELAEDGIDIFQYVTELGAYWKRIVIITVAAGIVSIVFFPTEKSIPTSSLEVEIGFKNINSGKYPDGSVFSKDDFISDAIVGKTFSALNELSSYGLSLESFKGAFLVKPIYPIDIRLAKKVLESGGGKLKATEIVEHYDKVRDFVPRNYSVKFSPPVEVPKELKEKALNKIVVEYSAYVKNNRFPNVYMVESLPKIDSENLSLPMAFDQLYKYFISILVDVEKKGSTLSGDYNKFTRFTSSGLMNSIQENLAMLESLIFDEMAIKDVERYKRGQLSLLKNVEIRVEELGKRADFRFKLAKLQLPTEITNDIRKNLLVTGADFIDPDIMRKSAGLPDVERPNIVSTSALFGILLSYVSQYYSLMSEAIALFDKKVEMESTLKSVKNKLERIGSVSHAVGTRDELIKKAEGNVKTIHSQLGEVAEKLDKMVIDYFLEYEPPIKRYFVLHGSSIIITYKKKALLSMAAAFFVIVFIQILFISYRTWKERKEAGEV